MERISKKEYYLNIAKVVAQRSTCMRRQYGAVIVKDDEIIATGYNGSPRGEDNCCDVGECWRESHWIPHGEQYEKCASVHAEQNAIISAARREMIGADLYLYGEEFGVEIAAKPCEICRKMITNAGISRVITVNSAQTVQPGQKKTGRFWGKLMVTRQNLESTNGDKAKFGVN